MFQMIKGASIPDVSQIREEYQINGTELAANVSAEKIQSIFESFLTRMPEKEPLFLYIEVPCKVDDELKLNPSHLTRNNIFENTHKDVYYLDGFHRDIMLSLLNSGIGELLIHDGFVCFGFGSLTSHVELGKSRYNVMTGYTHEQEAEYLTELFDMHNIPRVSEITTAWQQFSEDTPGESSKYEVDGKDVYVLIDQLKELGLYKAETRVED